eukprot:253607-Amphidinium_carterae.1
MTMVRKPCFSWGSFAFASSSSFQRDCLRGTERYLWMSFFDSNSDGGRPAALILSLILRNHLLNEGLALSRSSLYTSSAASSLRRSEP